VEESGMKVTVNINSERVAPPQKEKFDVSQKQTRVPVNEQVIGWCAAAPSPPRTRLTE